MEIKATVPNTDMMKVSQEIIEPIGVHLARNYIPPGDALSGTRRAFNQCRDIISGEPVIVGRRVIFDGGFEMRTDNRRSVVFMTVLLLSFFVDRQ